MGVEPEYSKYSSVTLLYKCIVSLSKLFDDQYAIYNAYLQLTGKVRTLLAWSSVVMFGIYLHNNGITSNFRNLLLLLRGKILVKYQSFFTSVATCM